MKSFVAYVSRRVCAPALNLALVGALAGLCAPQAGGGLASAHEAVDSMLPAVVEAEPGDVPTASATHTHLMDLASTGQAQPERPTLIFDSERYVLAYVGRSKAGPFNEYIRPNEKLDAWTKLVGVYTYEHQPDAHALALSIQRTVKQDYPAAVSHVAPAENGEGTVDFALYTAAPRPMHEFNIFRLRPSGQDVVAFQFAFRLYGSGRLSDNELESRRQRWMEMVKGAAIPKLADKIP